jgi:DNA-binding transcriptional regulator GbsR (MarR family)
MDKVLEKAIDHFSRSWGEIGFFWGINKVMGQLYAVLFSSAKPLTLDDLCRQLHISRGNASMNIRALKEWGVIRKVRIPGDRKDYYELDEDIWKIITVFVRERKKRELEPAMEAMEHSAALLKTSLKTMNAKDKKAALVFLNRLENMRKISDGVNGMLERFIHGEDVSSTTLTSIPVHWK